MPGEYLAMSMLHSGERSNIILNMKTIAITVDAATLELLDQVSSASDRFRSRSALVRAAIREFAEAERRRHEEARDRKVIRRHRELLTREAKALVKAQARA